MRKADSSSGRIWNFSVKESALFLNCIFDVESEDTTTNCTIFTNGTNPTIAYRCINCLFNIKSSGVNFYIAGSQNSNFVLANCVIMNFDKYFANSNTNVYLSTGANAPTNSADNLRYLATYGCNSSSFNGARGYLEPTSGYEIAGNGLDPVNPTAALASSALSQISLDSNHPLVGKGNANPFGDKLSLLGVTPAPEYDYNRRLRPTNPALGPFDIMSNNTTSSSGSSSIVGGGFVIDLVS
jgi:hypothetical protein